MSWPIYARKTASRNVDWQLQVGRSRSLRTIDRLTRDRDIRACRADAIEVYTLDAAGRTRTIRNSYNGRGGIRTHGTLLTYTHFPGVRLKPLGHSSLLKTLHTHFQSHVGARLSRVRAPTEAKRRVVTDRVRFELTKRLPVLRFSRPVPSATRPPVQAAVKAIGRRESSQRKLHAARRTTHAAARRTARHTHRLAPAADD